MGSLKDISTARMVAITQAWLDPAKDRGMVASLASGKNLLDLIQSAHEQLVATQTREDPVVREMAVVSEKQARIDRKHDRKIRAVWHLLNGLAEASDDPNEIAALLAARDELLPQGLSATQEDYQAEVKNVELAAARISPASKGMLKKLALPRTGTVWDVVEAWFAAGRELGMLEHHKDRLNASGWSGGAGAALNARNIWIRVVRHVESTLAIEGAKEDVVSSILRPVRMAEQETERQA